MEENKSKGTEPLNNNDDKNKLKKIEKKEKKNKESVGSKFANTIKKRWLITRTNTTLLIAIMVAVVILINSIVQSLDLTAIDCTTDQTYTLTDDSKERVADIQASVNIYFVGYDEDDTSVSLAKQYNDANENIVVEVVDTEEDLEFESKYGVSNDDYVIIVESGDSTITLDYYDLYTYDSDYNTVDLTEQKITSAILNVTSGYIPTVYFLAGYSDLSDSELSKLSCIEQYLDNEILEYTTTNLLTTGQVPDDCDTLIIMTPNKDFDDIVADAIIDYINNGGNILWLQSAIVDEESIDYTNVNRVLAEYGVDPFELGYIYETDSNNIVLSSSGLYYLTDIQSTTITDDLDYVTFVESTKINIADEDTLEELNVEETDLLLTSEGTYFTTDISGTGATEDEQGEFVVGAELVKTISEESDSEEETGDEEESTDEDTTEEGSDEEESEEDTEDDEDEEDDEDAITSTLIIYGDNYFIADVPIQYGSSYVYLIELGGMQNKDLFLNSIAYLTDNYEDITIRKSYSESLTSFTATEAETAIIARIIFIVPIAIILLGFVVWQIRRNKK